MTTDKRRAVLVGINQYNPPPELRTRLKAAPPVIFKRPKVFGDANYWKFDNLEGATADVELVRGLLLGFGFSENNIVVLKDQQATAGAILAALQKNLVDDAQSGDERVFYYSGHGNVVRNEASTELDQLDQSLVPADNWRDTPDIRDKEISRILWKAAKKGVHVTFVADSCHSGSIARGTWNARGKVRTRSGRSAGSTRARPTEPYTNDPADIDPKTGKPIDPEAEGVMVLSAAQRNQPAIETELKDGTHHGVFTWALARVLQSSGPNERMDRIFQRTVALMKADGVQQEPVMAGRGRESRGLWGQPADSIIGNTIAVGSVRGGVIRLRGGTAIGLYPGCQLKSLKKPPLEIEITASEGVAGSEAKVLGQGTANVGDLFQIHRWVVPAEVMLRIYMPSPAPAAQIIQTSREVGKLRNDSALQWLPDPTMGTPTHVMSWNGKSWILEENPATGPPVDLGNAPTAESVKQRLTPGARFLLLLPPSAEIAKNIEFSENTNAVQMLTSPAVAHYWLHGRLNQDHVEYAWLLPDATDESVYSRMAERSQGTVSPLPVRSDWIGLEGSADGKQTGASLTDKALRLGRLHQWLTLPTPPDPGHSTFPYRLALQETHSKQFRDSGEMRGGEQYKLYLRADPEVFDRVRYRVRPRWVYVFAIDQFGKGSLLFPPSGRGNEGNRFPYAPDEGDAVAEPLMALSGDHNASDFTVDEPYGLDTYFLLTTDEAIDNPQIFNFDAIRANAGTRGGRAKNPLMDLLSNIGSAIRAAVPARVPTHWSVDRMTFRSVPAN